VLFAGLPLFELQRPVGLPAAEEGTWSFWTERCSTGLGFPGHTSAKRVVTGQKNGHQTNANV